MKLPTVTILAGREKRATSGYPWVFSNEIQMDQHAKAIAPGSLVRLKVEGGAVLGVATFNPHTLIAARLLDRDEKAVIDEAWFVRRLENAQRVRARLFAEPYYRLVHAEADGIPGLIADRHGDIVTLQANTAGVDALLPVITAAMQKVTGASTIVLNRSGPAVVQEGLAEESRILTGTLPEKVTIRENGVTYQVDPIGGQKTGWFYDQRDNRAYVARFAKGQSVFDGFCYAGGFGLQTAAAGASAVHFVDQSAGALQLAEAAAGLNGFSNCRFTKADVLAELEQQAAAGTRYGIVIVDPPAFIKNKKDMAAGLRGYRKLARLAAAVTAAEGILCICTCSHHAALPEWSAEVARGIYEAGRSARLLRTGGTGGDHPVHPLLPESAYLKAQTFVLD